MQRRTNFVATIQMKGIDRIGMLNEVTSVISSQLNVNMQKLVVTCNDGIFDAVIELVVYDRSDVKIIMDAIKRIEDIEEINQIQ